MAAVITATPVIVTAFTFSQTGRTTIAWNTGNPFVQGTLEVSIDAGPFNPAKEIGGTPVAKGVSGSTRQNIAFGRKYVFRITNPVLSNPVLASVSVESRELLGLPVGVVDEIKNRMPLTQGITNVRVFPAIESVRILFKTRQPTVPVVDIKQTDNQQVAGAAFPFFGGARTTHDLAFPLAQNTDFTFHIFAAPGATAVSSAKSAEASGQFRTGSRKATVFFDHIFVHTDGDPGSLGDGDFQFYMGAGDIDSQQMLGATDYRDDISGGDDRSINQSVAIDNAPVGLWVKVEAEEDDNTFSRFGRDPATVSFAAEGSTWTTDDDVEIATVTRWFDLSDAGPVPQEIAFTLETGPKHIDFSLNCRLRMEAVPGANLAPLVKKSAKPIVRAKTVAMLAVGARVAVAGRTTHVLLLAPDGGLYQVNARDRTTAAASARNTPWTRLAGEVREPLTVVAVEDALHLLAVGADGQVMHNSIAPDAVQAASGDEKWRPLGGHVVAPVVAAAAGAGVELFALDADGSVLHRSLNGEAGHEWRSIGDAVIGSLNAFTTSRGDIGLVALDRSGDVKFLPWSAEQARGESLKWRSIGKAPRGVLSAEFIDDVVVLAVLSDDETVHAAPWRDYPEPPAKLKWQALGTMNDLISARFSVMKAE